MVFFCLGGLASGNLMRTFSTRVVFLLAAVFLFAGFGLSSRVQELWQIFIAYGVLCVFGVGITYNAIVATMISLFRRKGMVSGLMMFAFGLGGMILGTGVTRLILQHDGYFCGLRGWIGVHRERIWQIPDRCFL